ncbi:hypothetical protein ACP70R_003617 [Stipagrostis hirtigluma subsp. patula]
MATVEVTSLRAGHVALLAAPPGRRIVVPSVRVKRAEAVRELIRGRVPEGISPPLLLLRNCVLPALIADLTSVAWRNEMRRLATFLESKGHIAGGTFSTWSARAAIAGASRSTSTARRASAPGSWTRAIAR